GFVFGDEERRQADSVLAVSAGLHIWFQRGSELFLDTAQVVFGDVEDRLPVAEQWHRLIVAVGDEPVELGSLVCEEYSECLAVLIIGHFAGLIRSRSGGVVDQGKGTFHRAPYAPLRDDRQYSGFQERIDVS